MLGHQSRLFSCIFGSNLTSSAVRIKNSRGKRDSWVFFIFELKMRWKDFTRETFVLTWVKRDISTKVGQIDVQRGKSIFTIALFLSFASLSKKGSILLMIECAGSLRTHKFLDNYLTLMLQYWWIRCFKAIK